MSQPLLEIKNVTKIYGGTGFFRKSRMTVALQDFNLTIAAKPATITTIAGESGSGKTTLANLVLGFIRPTSGQIFYKGVDVGAMDGRQLMEYRREVQAVFQDPYAVYNPFYRVKHIFDLVIKNFKLARSKAEAREMIEEALNVVGLRGEGSGQLPAAQPALPGLLIDGGHGQSAPPSWMDYRTRPFAAGHSSGHGHLLPIYLEQPRHAGGCARVGARSGGGVSGCGGTAAAAWTACENLSSGRLPVV